MKYKHSDEHAVSMEQGAFLVGRFPDGRIGLRLDGLCFVDMSPVSAMAIALALIHSVPLDALDSLDSPGGEN